MKRHSQGDDAPSTADSSSSPSDPKKQKPAPSIPVINAESLTAEAFRPYGDVIERPQTQGTSANQGTAKRFNFITQLVNLRQTSPPSSNSASSSSVSPTKDSGVPDITPELQDPPAKANLLLERHKFSTQMFVPMTPASNNHSNHPITTPSYLVIVALNHPDTDTPNLSTLKAFVASSAQGINYKVATWHHPMVGLPPPPSIESSNKFPASSAGVDGLVAENKREDGPGGGSDIDFVCLVWERGPDQRKSDEDTEEYHYDPARQIKVRVPEWE
ncbi:hypothetical protein HK102_011050 [Quaeritorhiza haematococci]|nr:hypothetical protein HK102_011050 [Quaeritorhiza haematococci]